MEFFDVINNRYSFRGEFGDEEISRETVKKILNAAIAAPSGMDYFTTRFIVVDDKNLINAISNLIPMMVVKSAKVLVIALIDSDRNPSQMDFDEVNYGAAIENLLLAVTAEGLATVWTDGTCRHPQIQRGLRDLLNIPSNLQIKAVLPIGIPKVNGKLSNKEPFETLVQFNRF